MTRRDLASSLRIQRMNREPNLAFGLVTRCDCFMEWSIVTMNFVLTVADPHIKGGHRVREIQAVSDYDELKKPPVCFHDPSPWTASCPYRNGFNL